MAPVVHGLETKYCGQLNFVYLDIDDGSNNVFKEALGYVYQPHLLLLDPEGNIIIQWVGFVGEADLETAILNAIGE
ncbi:MAG TPA: hypothetical protein VMN57_04585 [Anaerolineales bacterium]|nr:hypothetical protein [Anaerolineales bacterium]